MRAFRRITHKDMKDCSVAVDFLARELSAMRGMEEPSDLEREDALIFGMSRR